MLNKRKQMQHLVGQMRLKEGLIREYILLLMVYK